MRDLRTKTNVGFAVALLILFIVGVLSFRSVLGLEGTVDEQARVLRINTGLEQVLGQLSEAEVALRSYVMTGDTVHAARFRSTRQEIEYSVVRLRQMCGAYPAVDAQLKSLEKSVTARVAALGSAMQHFDRHGLAATVPLLDAGAADDSIDAQAIRIGKAVQQTLLQHESQTRRFAKLTLMVIIFGTLVAVLFLAIASRIIHREVASRNQAYATIAEREDRLADLINSASELIQETTPDGALIDTNRSWQETLGYDTGEISRLSMTGIIDPQFHEQWQAAVARALTGERVNELALSFRGRDGRIIHVIGSLSTRFENGRASSIRGIFRDVTQTLRAEEEVRNQEHRNAQFLEALPLGVLVASADGRPMYVNHSADEILGAAGADGYVWRKAGSGARYPEDELPITRALRGERLSVTDIEVDVGERKVPLEMSAVPVYATDGAISGAITTFSDITERREVERLKDELISVVSHELRTPLTSIRGALGLVGSGRLGQLNEQGKRMIDIAVMDTDRLVRLINDMLDIERMEAGRIEMHKTVCSTADLAEQAAATVRPLAEKAGVKIVTDANHVVLSCDADRIVQTLTNLIGNAVKFSPPAGTVTIRARLISNEVEFRVIDEGRGIPSEKIEKIFERFQQVDASDAREKGGAGLGLAISRSIVVQHGGRIWAESDGMNGSTFVFTLPALTQATQVAPEKTGEDPTLLLVAEDDSAAAEVLKTVLEAQGYVVAIAGTGREAIELAGRLQPAAILLDVVMPEMNGWEAMSVLKHSTLTKDIPIIVVSGLASELKHDDDRVAAWLEKPFREEELDAALQSAFSLGHAPLVLIVEDDENLSSVLAAQFESSGLRTAQAHTGAKAIEMAEHLKPDLVVLDLMLPDTDGFDVVEWLRRHEQLQRLPLVVYTSSELGQAERSRLRLGPSLFMTKSHHKPDDVAQRVARLLNRVSGRPDIKGK